MNNRLLTMNLLLDLFFPKKCVLCSKIGSYICSDCYGKIEFIKFPVCTICQRQAVGGKTHPGCRGRLRLDGLVTACKYEGAVKRLIQKVKYKWVWDMEKICLDLICESLWQGDLVNCMQRFW